MAPDESPSGPLERDDIQSVNQLVLSMQAVIGQLRQRMGDQCRHIEIEDIPLLSLDLDMLEWMLPGPLNAQKRRDVLSHYVNAADARLRIDIHGIIKYLCLAISELHPHISGTVTDTPESDEPESQEADGAMVIDESLFTICTFQEADDITRQWKDELTGIQGPDTPRIEEVRNRDEGDPVGDWMERDNEEFPEKKD